MATPLYKSLKANGKTSYVFPGAKEDISAEAQNENYNISFNKFVLLNIDLESLDLENPDAFNTESINPITDRGDLLVNHLRNYVANHESTIRETLINNNTFFYNPNELKTNSERIFWKWLRKAKGIQFEPAIPNDEYIDGEEFSIDQNLPEDYFKEYLWKERDSIEYSISNIIDTGNDKVDPNDTNAGPKRIYRITTTSATNIKPLDTISISSEGNINIGFTGTREFTVDSVETDTAPDNDSKNNWIYVYSDITLVFNNFAVSSLQLVYSKVVQYVGEVSAFNNVIKANSSYTETIAFVPDQTGATPDILFRIDTDSNYSPGLQYPILPSQEQPEIIGGELFDSPIVLNPDKFPGDQFAYFDVDQKYQNSDGFLDRRRGDYYGVLENNRRNERVAEAPYVYPEFDGANIDGLGIDFDTEHYVKMNIPGKISKNFDEFNAQSFNEEPPKDFEFNAILWYYTVEDKTNTTTQEVKSNLYGITFLNSVEDNQIETYKKFVANGEQDGLSYEFSLNKTYNISNDNPVEKFDPDKIYSLYNFDLFNEVMKRVAVTSDIFMGVTNDLERLEKEVSNLKTLLYTQTSLQDINFRIDSLNRLLNLYKSNQIANSDTIVTQLDETTNPPQLKLNSIDSRFGNIQQLPVNILYNASTNTVVDYKVLVPRGKDFVVNVINNDLADIQLDRNLNIVIEKDLDYKQSCTINIFPRNSRFNKKLNISMITSTVDDIDRERGYQIFEKSIDLPIDNNLNPNLEIDSINNRWSNIPDVIYPQNVITRKISNNYYVGIELTPMMISTFRSGDVLLLENFRMQYNNITTDISGQYRIIGDIENNILTFQVNLQTYKDFFDAINADNGSVTNEYNIPANSFLQPSFISYNTGYEITITNVDRDSNNLNEKYLISTKKMKQRKTNN